MNDLIRTLLDLPPQASTFATSIDLLHFVVISTTMLGATLVFLVAVAFVIRYRMRAPGELTQRTEASGPTELATVGVVLTIFVGFWVVGATQFDRMMTPPENSLPVYVTAKEWMWKFSYSDGRSSMDVLTVPVHRPIKVVMTSRDVIHSFYVPAFRIKHDVVPGRYYVAWFEATAPGVFAIECAEYCGAGHSRMLGQVRVLSTEDYRRWEESATPGESQDLAAEGLKVASRRGCLSCHTIDGQPHIGPTWAGLYGAQVKLDDGRSVLADDAYLTRSMMDPLAEVVGGFKPTMPVYRGVLEEPEVAALVELIASLRSRPFAPSVTLPPINPTAPAPTASMEGTAP